MMGLLPIAAPIAVLVTATHVDAPPAVDGRLDDPVWAAARPADAFTQKFPDEGTPPVERTTVRVVYDADDLYIGVDCIQELAPLVAHLTRRDRAVESDRVTIDLDTRRDGKSAFHFEVNAAGVLVDGVRFDDTELSMDWDENWDARTARTATGWSAELRIPLRVLRFDAVSEQSWGIQVRRYVSRRQEVDELAFIPRDEAGEVSHYGGVGPFTGLRRGRAIELRPFVLGQARRSDAAAGDPAATDLDGSVGVDAKWHLTPDLTLNAAVNPDFAQVEADQVILNLSNVELELPEKRPFFLDGVDELSTPIQLVYTRRIGLDPIWGAAKLVGRRGGTHIGLLSAVTRGDAADGEATSRGDTTSFYDVVRLRRGLGDNGDLGLIATSVLRLEPETEGAPRLLHDAFTGGLDWRWRSPGGGYLFAGQVAGTLIPNGPPRQLPDGTVVSAGDAAPGVLARIAKEASTYRFDAFYEAYGRRFDANDLGFVYRQNLHHGELDLERNDSRPGRFFLENAQRIEIYRRWNLDGLELSGGYQINSREKFHNFWSMFTELHYRPAHYDDREFGDGSALERAGLVGLEEWITSDPRRAVSAEFGTTAQVLSNGLNLDFEADVIFRVLPQLDLELLGQVGYTAGEPRAVGGDASSGYLLGDLEARQVGLTLRGTYTFTPRLTLQVYAQGFLAAVHFSDFTTAMPMADGRVRLADLAPVAAPPENPDFQEAALNANVVLRWEWRLGSTLFLVYTRSQAPEVDLLPGERPMLDVRALGRGPATDALLLKLTYWWG